VTQAPRDRDRVGRPQSARPRDALGRPLPYGSPAGMEEIDPALLEGTPAELLAQAQRLLAGGRPFQAHEILEAGWRGAPEGERPLWRALAQLAVGVTHSRRGNAPGAKALYARAAREFADWDSRTAPHGIDVEGLAETARRLAKTQQPQAIRLIRERG
jgi:predicted metal-dependent hydrolase